MFAWIVLSVVVQANSHLSPFVDRHFLVADPSRKNAVAIVRKLYGGNVSVVGFIEAGRSHYYPATHV